MFLGSGCDSVGRAVASNARGPRFESTQISKLLYPMFNCLPTVNCNEKTKIKKKRAGMVHFYKKLLMLPIGSS